MSLPQAEPLAIIGMGCRLPGTIETLEDYWQVLIRGKNVISEVPLSRWNIDTLYDPNPRTKGKIALRHGGFLKEIRDFDYRFFGMTPREATHTDPQQRLLLEVAWEALENANLVPESLKGSQTGVYVGVGSTDQAQRIAANNYRHINAYSVTGASLAAVSGRLSNTFGLCGPSFSLDTACSSSLIAFHLACQGLRVGEARNQIEKLLAVLLRDRPRHRRALRQRLKFAGGDEPVSELPPCIRQAKQARRRRSVRHARIATGATGVSLAAV